MEFNGAGVKKKNTQSNRYSVEVLEIIFSGLHQWNLFDGGYLFVPVLFCSLMETSQHSGLKIRRFVS